MRPAEAGAAGESASSLLRAAFEAAGLADPGRVGELHRRIVAATDDPGILASSAAVAALALSRCGYPEDAAALLTGPVAARHPALANQIALQTGADADRTVAGPDELFFGTVPDLARATAAELRAVVERGRRHGGVGLGAEAAVVFAEHLVNAARWDEALALIDELEAYAAGGGWPAIEADAAALRAAVLAFRGRPEQATAVLDQVWYLVDLGANRATHLRLLRSAGLAGLAAVDWADAYRHFRAMYTPAGEPLHPVYSVLSIAELATAALRCGARDEVAGIVREALRRHEGRGQTRLRLLLHQAAALVLDEDAEHHHRLAIVDPAGESWPLERALARIRYGEWLRRCRRPLDARPVIQAALLTLERLGTPSLVELTRAELRAGGYPGEAGAGSSEDPLACLTPQERQVVILAAQGLRNRAIAEQLFLSTRTVGFHLYKAYPKLGVEGRHQLARIIRS